MRRTMMRYVNLCYVIVASMISPQVKARFPTLSHLVDAGMKSRTFRIFSRSKYKCYRHFTFV